MKVMIGAGETTLPGWIATNETELNLVNRESFQQFFGQQKAQAMLAEHVWEHLTIDEGIVAAKNCYDYLEEGGYLRIAVPDGNFHDPDFLQLVQVGGPGPEDHPAFTHKVLYDYQRLINVFEEAGFMIDLLEYCDEQEVFHYKYWNPADGKIGRSLRFDTRNSREKMGMVSIILDAHKPFLLDTSKEA